MSLWLTMTATHVLGYAEKDHSMVMSTIASNGMTSEFKTLQMKTMITVPKAILTEESGNMATDLEGEPDVVP